MFICYDVIENLAIFTKNKLSLFPDFTAMMMAFFQNLLGSITQLISIYKNLQKGVGEGDLTPVFF